MDETGKGVGCENHKVDSMEAAEGITSDNLETNLKESSEGTSCEVLQVNSADASSTRNQTNSASDGASIDSASSESKGVLSGNLSSLGAMENGDKDHTPVPVAKPCDEESNVMQSAGDDVDRASTRCKDKDTALSLQESEKDCSEKIEDAECISDDRPLLETGGDGESGARNSTTAPGTKLTADDSIQSEPEQAGPPPQTAENPDDDGSEEKKDSDGDVIAAAETDENTKMDEVPLPPGESMRSSCLPESGQQQEMVMHSGEEFSLPSDQPSSIHQEEGENQQTSLSPSQMTQGASTCSLPVTDDAINDSTSKLLKVEDSVNNNIQTSDASCDNSQLGELVESQENKSVIPDLPKTSSQAPDVKQCVVPSIEISESSKERSTLMQYLGLQPVQDSQKLPTKGPADQADSSKRKSPFGLSFCESFSNMPSLDIMSTYDMTRSSHMSPFEVSSEGSRSPEPPIILAETPVVGSSPPRHDPDVIESAVTDLAPRNTMQPCGRDDLVSDDWNSSSKDFNVPSQIPCYKKVENLCNKLPENGGLNAEITSTMSGKTDYIPPTFSPSKSKSNSLHVPTVTVPCPHCHRTFKNRNQLRGHLRWHIHDPVNLLPGRWQKESSHTGSESSSLGKRAPSTFQSSRQHAYDARKYDSKTETVHEETLQKPSKSVDGAVTCNLCQKVFGTSLKLRGHMLVHKNKKKQHWKRRQHWKKGPSRMFESAVHQCEVCSKVFATELKLRGHMMSHTREVHPRSKGVKRLGSVITENSETCGDCSSSTDKSEHGMKKQAYKCETCLKAFPTFRQLNGHKGVHSSKWKLANDLHQVGRPPRVKGVPQSLEGQDRTGEDTMQQDNSLFGTSFASQSVIPEESGIIHATAENHPEANRKPDVIQGKPKKLCTSLKYQMQGKVFKCSHCYLVFATRHRVRKHLFKVHSTIAEEGKSFTEEKVDGCKFCEVFKKRGRGRPKRGENTLIRCVHGKMVVGYNLSNNFEKERRKIRLTSNKLKNVTSLDVAMRPENVIQQKCSVKLNPVNVETIEEKEGAQDDSPQTLTQQSKTANPLPAIKRRGRPPKMQKKILRLPKGQKPQGAKSRVQSRLSHDGAMHRTIPSFRKHARSRKEMAYLGRHLKTGWDPKKQRFIGRPYTCHLCKMSYRSERQLCSHMRSHDINIFDLAELPADQRGIHFKSDKDVEEMSDENQVIGATKTCDSPRSSSMGGSSQNGTPDMHLPKVTSPGVGNTCFVCKKEFDSDNMFHQHLLGRHNKRCSKEWMKQTYGFGMRSKITNSEDQCESQDSDESKPTLTETLKSSDNVYVIDKISAGSYQGTGVFSNLQQKAPDKIDMTLQGQVTNGKDPTQEDVRDVEQLHKLGNTAHVDAGTVLAPPKKGDVLNAVINRLSQSSKVSKVRQEITTCTEEQQTNHGTRREDHTEKLDFKCDSCTKAFNRRQKLVLHSRIHKPKVPTIMDHVEYANQRDITASLPEVPSEDDKLEHNITLSDNKVDDSESVDAVPVLHFVYNCTECPKKFTSNHRFVNHLKMHRKSTGAHASTFITKSAENRQAIRPVEENTTQETKETLSEEHELQEESREGNEGQNMAYSSTDDETLSTESQKQNCTNNIESVSEQSGDKDSPSKACEIRQNDSSNRPRLLLKIDAATMQRLHDCPDCPKAFKSRRQLASHRKLHDIQQMCELPEEDTAPEDTCAEQTCANLQKSLTMSVDETNTSSREMKTAQLQGGETDYEESIYSFTNEDETVSSLNDTAPASDVFSQDQYAPCKICDKVMKKTQLGGHMKSHTKGLLTRLSTPLPSQTNTGQEISHVVRHQEHHEECMDAGNIASTCYDQMPGQNDDHLSNKTVNTATLSEMPYAEAEACQESEVCNDMPPGADNYPEVNSQGDESFKCDVCSAQYGQYEQLTQHMKTHVGVYPPSVNSALPVTMNDSESVPGIAPTSKPTQVTGCLPRKVYPCDLCGFSFYSFRQFRVHISQAHGGKFQYRLMIQQKEAAEAGAFSGEPEAVNKTHPHKCDVCGRRFKRLALLIYHLNKLHKGWKQRLCMMNVRSRPRQSQVSAPSASSVSGSQSKTGTDQTDLPFTCELCGKSFRMKVQLCGHMKTHGRVGHSPIKISPLKTKGKYTLRKRGKPDFRLSDDWILDMGDEPVVFDNILAMQQVPQGPQMTDKAMSMNATSSGAPFAPMYTHSQLQRPLSGSKKLVPHFQGQDVAYQMPMATKNMPISPPLTAEKVSVAPPPPDPSKFITMQMEPLLQQMLHRCLLCHSYFSSQESAVLHCKEVHFKKKVKPSAQSGPLHMSSHPLGRSHPAKPQAMATVRPSTFNKVVTPPPSPNFPPSHNQQTSLPFAGTLPNSARSSIPSSVPSAKTISQTPFNEMLYHVETIDGQTRYVCNTCHSTFLHYNFLMSHLAEHNHLAYTCLQCGYATYSEKDYQLHCQLHDGQISKRDRAVRPKPPTKPATKTTGPFPKAVATCHICQRSFVNLKGLQAHMVLHSANFSSISERRNESKRVSRKAEVLPQQGFLEVNPEPLPLTRVVEEQTEALDLSVKPVSNIPDSPCDEVLDLSINSRSTSNKAPSPSPSPSPEPSPVPMKDPPQLPPVIIQMKSSATTLPDVCQVEEKEQPVNDPTPPPVVEPAPSRKVKNSIRLVGAIDVDVASLENKYSVVTDLLDTDSDISPDLPPSNGRDSPSVNAEGDEVGAKSPKKFRTYKCSMCQYSTDFKDSMERHEQKHRKFLTLACHQCSYRTPEKRLMLRHVLTIHEKQKPYQCKLCHYSSAYKHHLKRHHTKRHQQPLHTCAQCEFTCDDVHELELHSATHTEPKIYKCKVCAMTFDTSKLLKSHKQTFHKKKKNKKGNHHEGHSASSQGESSESTQATEKEDVPSPSTDEPVVLKYPCKLCTYQTNDQNDLTKHLMQNHFGGPTKEGLGDVCTTAQCPQCGYLTGKDQLKVHMQIHDSGELFNCEQCLFKASSQEELDTHVQEKHKVKASAKLMCKMCGAHFWDADDMKQHTEMHLKDSAISVKNPFLCNMCPLKLMNRRDALRHLQLHTDRYPFKCRHCIFSCFTKASLQRHLVIHRHTNKPKSHVIVRKNSRKSLSTGSHGSSGSSASVTSDDRKGWKKNQSSKSTNFGPVASRLPMYECAYCDHSFRVAEEWQRHEKRHRMAWPE
ncbi:uncharacterized protein [Diadema antillarum]|uniref:uncharacterized protein isoform X1 n=1 Tax=Diadema antillarum TaxID=105358 RepID=UPI003A89CCB5